LLKELSKLLGDNVISNAGATPLSANTFNGAPLSMTVSPNASYFQMNEANKGRWIMTSSDGQQYNFGNLKIDSNGKPSSTTERSNSVSKSVNKKKIQ
jgi:hypothetical protein